VDVFRLIYRLDFPRNYEIINLPGEIVRILVEEPEKDFFSEVGDDRIARKVLGRTIPEDGKVLKAMSVEPTAIVLEYESADGVPISRLEDIPDFKAMLALLEITLNRFKITNINRAGLRLFVFDNVTEKFDRTLQFFKAQVSAGLLDACESSLGQAMDVGFVFEGKAESGLSYNFRTGPFRGASEVRRYLSHVHPRFAKDSARDVVFDVDVYEQNFSYGRSNAKWWRPAAETARKVTQRVGDLIRQGT
jgi:hypothetical protein